jgi:hypothetical protein
MKMLIFILVANAFLLTSAGAVEQTLQAPNLVVDPNIDMKKKVRATRNISCIDYAEYESGTPAAVRGVVDTFGRFLYFDMSPLMRTATRFQTDSSNETGADWWNGDNLRTAYIKDETIACLGDFVNSRMKTVDFDYNHTKACRVHVDPNYGTLLRVQCVQKSPYIPSSGDGQYWLDLYRNHDFRELHW